MENVLDESDLPSYNESVSQSVGPPDLQNFNQVVQGGHKPARCTIASSRGKIRIFTVHKLPSPIDLAFFPDSSLFVAIYLDGGFQLCDTTRGKLGHQMSKEMMNSISISPDGQYLVAVRDYGVELWNPLRGLLVGFFRGNREKSKIICISPDSNRIAIGGFEAIQVFNMHTQDQQDAFTINVGYDSDVQMLRAMAFLPDDRRLMIATNSKIQVRDIDSETTTTSSVTIESNLAKFSPDGRYLASVNSNKIEIWRVCKGDFLHEPVLQCRFPLLTAARSVASMEFSPDNSLLAVSMEIGHFRVSHKQLGCWDTFTGQRLCKSEVYRESGPRFKLKFSPDGLFLASFNTKGVRIWEAQGEEQREA